MTKSQLRCQIYVSQGQGQAPPPPPPPLFLDQTEARRAEKKLLETAPLPLSECVDLLLQALYQKLQRTIKWSFKTVNYWSNKFSTATLICNPFQSSSSLSISAFFYIGCVLYTFLSSFEQLFLKFTQNMVAVNKNDNKVIISIVQVTHIDQEHFTVIVKVSMKY